MTNETLLCVEGLVRRPLELSRADLAAIDPQSQVPDAGAIVPGRTGQGVRLAAVLKECEPLAEADYLTLHSSSDDFHASVPLSAVRDTGVLVYALGGQSLPASAGGPIRFLVPDSAACHSAEVDECANVKFVDRLELSAGRGPDNRPSTLAEHAKLHEREGK